MNLNRLIAFILFFGSYCPLSIILLFRDLAEGTGSFCNPLNTPDCTFPKLAHPEISISFTLFTSACFIIFYIFQKKITSKSEVIIEEVRSVPGDLVNYTLPYIVTFIGLDLGSRSDIIGTISFFFFLFLLSYKSGEIMMNPLLLLLDWKFFEVQGKVDNQPTTFRAISKTTLEPGDKFRSRNAQSLYVLIERSK